VHIKYREMAQDRKDVGKPSFIHVDDYLGMYSQSGDLLWEGDYLDYSRLLHILGIEYDYTYLERERAARMLKSHGNRMPDRLERALAFDTSDYALAWDDMMAAG